MLNHNLSFVQKGNNCGCSVHNSRDREMLHAFCCFALFFVFLAQVCACVRIRAHLCLFVVIRFIFGGAQSPVHPFLLVINKVKPNRRLIDAKTDHF